MPDDEMKAGMRLEDAGDRVRPRKHEAGGHPAAEGAASGSEADGAEHEHSLDWREIVRIVFVAGAAGAFWFAGVHLSFPLVMAGAICALAGGYPIFQEAIENILERGYLI
jgi:P-type Cu+ transporter